ncbi:MAG: hypothetical protein HYY04_01495 [Chloroflexi bacterium]|nr:hypothetical protein [Chloroflexota bacterium]
MVMHGIYLLAPAARGFGVHVLVGIGWYLLLTIVSIRETERLSWAWSFVIAIIASTANTAIEFVFIR